MGNCHRALVTNNQQGRTAVVEALRCVSPDSILTGWDFSTGAVKCLAFDLNGRPAAEVRLPTDLWTEGGVSELNLMQLEGQARASVRAMAGRLRQLGRLERWVAGGISATHHTAGRIDADRVQVRRAICWNDHSLAAFHAAGLRRLGGQDRVRQLIGGPWAIRYTLSHLLKDETHLPPAEWQRTERILPHGALAAGFLTGNFDVVSVSAAASTGIMDLRSNQWCRGMLDALERPELRELAWKQLPCIVDAAEPLGPLAMSLAAETGIATEQRPLIFPTSDDQQAGLVGGGAVDAGQMAIILGNSAVVNASSSRLPVSDELDAMRLNWGPYLWMRCYNNGAQFLDRVVGSRPDWENLEQEVAALSAGSGRHRGAAFYCSRAVAGHRHGKAAMVPSRAEGPRQEVSGRPRSTGVSHCPRRPRARGCGADDQPNYRVGRNRPKPAHVRNPGLGVGAAPGTLAIP